MKLTMRFVAVCEEGNVDIARNLEQLRCTSFWIESAVPVVVSGHTYFITAHGLRVEKIIQLARAIYQDRFEELIYGSKLLLPYHLFRPQMKLEPV